MGLSGTLTASDASSVVTGRLVVAGAAANAVWQLPDEAPVAILYNGEQFAVMMATPQDIEDFAVGFSLTEGIADNVGDIEDVRLAEAADGLIVNIKVDPAKMQRAEGRRRTLTGRSGCGLCGAQSLEAVMQPLRKVKAVLPAANAVEMALKGLKARQPMNALNRSTHAAGFAAMDGAVRMVREDIGRHNALDKLAGALARQNIAPATGFIVLSSRFSVEMAQKAAVCGVGFVASVSAPSSLALQLAQRAGMKVACAAPGGLMFFD
ncbi:MAG: formate dehydrogenase accessory sulfurtransferase FdhD [Rhizobiaceae bacterium]